MKEFTEILTFTYKGKEYKMYLDNKNKKFFTGIYDGVEAYIPIEEYVDLLIMFASKKETIKNIDNSDMGQMFNENYNFQKPKPKKKRIVPKVIAGGVATLLTASVLTAGISFHHQQQEFSEALLNHESPRIEMEYNSTTSDAPTYRQEKDYSQYLDGGAADSEFELDTYIDHRDFSNRIYIYDMDYADLVFDTAQPTLDDCINMINSNNEIPSKFKPLLIEYCTRLYDKYPNVEKRPFYQNLKTLSVVEVDKQEMLKTTISVDSVGCYVQTENRIYLLEDYNFVPGTWDYQVIYHELSHCLRISVFKDDEGNSVKFTFDGLNYWDIPNAEAMNSLFAVSLLDYEELDIAYQYQSNFHKIILENIDNYTLDDYVNHSMTYYAQQLDEYTGDENYATKMFALMEAQYNDFHNDSFEAPQSDYYPLYDYISKIYLGKHLNSNMSYDEARAAMDQMLEELLYDVPEKYNIDTNHFYEYLNDYCETIGIPVNQNVK